MICQNLCLVFSEVIFGASNKKGYLLNVLHMGRYSLPSNMKKSSVISCQGHLRDISSQHGLCCLCNFVLNTGGTSLNVIGNVNTYARLEDGTAGSSLHFLFSCVTLVQI